VYRTVRKAAIGFEKELCPVHRPSTPRSETGYELISEQKRGLGGDLSLRQSRRLLLVSHPISRPGKPASDLADSLARHSPLDTRPEAVYLQVE